MGGNRTPPKPQLLTPEFPGDEVRGVIDDARDRTRDATEVLEGKASGYRSDSEANQIGLGLTPAGQNTVTKTRTVKDTRATVFDNQAAQDYIGRTLDEDKDGFYNITRYNNSSDLEGMFQDYQGLYDGSQKEGTTGQFDGKHGQMRNALIEAERGGYVSHDDDYSLKNARGFQRFLNDRAQSDFSRDTGELVTEDYEVDAGKNTLTGRTMSQSMGDYRQNYDNTMTDITSQSRDFLKNYESGLLGSESVKGARSMLAEDAAIFDKATDGYRTANYDMMEKAVDKGYAKQQAAYNTGKTDIGAATTGASSRQDTAATAATGQTDDAFGDSLTQMRADRDTASANANTGFTAGARRQDVAAIAGYNTDIYDDARTNFGTRADEGYTRYGDALTAVGARGRDFAANTNLNMLRNNAYQDASAAPPTLRMAAALQNQLQGISDYQAFGGQQGAGNRGDIRGNLATNYDFGFDDQDAAGNFERRFDRTNLVANNAQPFFNAIRNPNDRGGQFNFAPQARQDYRFTPGTNFEGRSRNAATRDYYNRFMGGYSPRG